MPLLPQAAQVSVIYAYNDLMLNLLRAGCAFVHHTVYYLLMFVIISVYLVRGVIVAVSGLDTAAWSLLRWCQGTHLRVQGEAVTSL